jgi:chromosome segregation ATPase
MSAKLTLIAAAVFVAFTGVQAEQAGAANSVEARMREALKKTMLQLRDSEAARAAAVAAQTEAETKNTELEAKIKELTKNIETLTKQSIKDKEAADKNATELTAKITARETEAKVLTENLEKWKVAFKKVEGIAKETEAQRGAAVSKAILLERKVADQQVKNAEMFKIGNEVLTRYKNYGLGSALAAREPFVGTMRVKLENIFQELADKLQDQKIKSDDGKKKSSAADDTPPPPPAATAAAAKPAEATKAKPPVAKAAAPGR